jgi:hypothetical protein
MTRPEIITEARRKRDAGDFNRRIATRTPHNLHMDSLALDCGHEVFDMRPLEGRGQELRSCDQCASEWMRSEKVDNE